MPKYQKVKVTDLKFKKQYLVSFHGNDRNYLNYIGKKSSLYLFVDQKKSTNQKYVIYGLRADDVHSRVFIELEK